MTLGEWSKKIETLLRTSRFRNHPFHADPRWFADFLLREVLDLPGADLYLKADRKIGSPENDRLQLALARLQSGEPFQYIVGHTYFWKDSFACGPGVLIPRKETELLVERLVLSSGKIAELGAGSGNLGISVCKENPKVDWWAFERSPYAAAYAQYNQRQLLSRDSGYHLKVGDFFLEAPRHGPYDAIAANPPYLAASSPLGESVNREPALSLYGGSDGLEIIERILQKAPLLLKPKGLLYLEMGADQAESLRTRTKKYSFVISEVVKDYAGLDRILIIRKGT